MSARFDELDDGLDNLGQHSTSGTPAATESEAQALPSLSDRSTPRVPSFTPRPPDASDPSGMPPAFDDGLDDYSPAAWVHPLEGQKPDWPNPPDYFGTVELPSVQERHLPPATAPYILDRAKVTTADALQFALNGLVVASGCIRTGISLQMEGSAAEADFGHSWREKPVLWGAIVAKSGYGKEVALRSMMHRMQFWQTKLLKDGQSALEEWTHESKAYELELQSYYRDVKKSPGLPRPELRERPSRDLLWLDDTTVQAVAKVIQENDRGKVSIIKDELSGWFGSFDAFGARGGDNDRPQWLSFYESAERPIARVGGGFWQLKSWGGPILGGIQPDVIKKLAIKFTSDGMLPRFMVVCPKPQGDEDEALQNDRAALELWNRVIDGLVNMEPRGTRFEPQPVILSRAADAFVREKRRWIKQQVRCAADANLASMLSKWQGLHGRLMIVSHCIADAAAGFKVPSPEVSLDVAKQTWAWMEEILLPHACHFYEHILGGGTSSEWGKRFIEYVLPRNIRTIKTYELRSNWSWGRRNIFDAENGERKSKELKTYLVDSGVIRMGINDKTWVINPYYFDGRFDKEAARLREEVEYDRNNAHPAFKKQQQRKSSRAAGD